MPARTIAAMQSRLGPIERDMEGTGTSDLQQITRDEEEIPMARQKIVVGMLLLGLALQPPITLGESKMAAGTISMSPENVTL